MKDQKKEKKRNQQATVFAWRDYAGDFSNIVLMYQKRFKWLAGGAGGLGISRGPQSPDLRWG